MKAKGPAYLKSGAYREIYQKILDGGYSSASNVSPPKRAYERSSPAFQTAQVGGDRNGAHRPLDGFELSRQDHNNSDAGLFHQAIVERTLAGEDDWTGERKAEAAHSPTSGLESGSLLPLLATAQVKPQVGQVNPLAFSNQKGLKSQASAVIERHQGPT